MRNVHALLLWAAWPSVAVFAQVNDPKPAARPEPIRARPAVLILRVTADPHPNGTSRHLSIVEPRGLREVPLAPDRRAIEYADDGTPLLGPGYELVRNSQPDPQRDTQYYVYYVDFNNPMFVDRWRDFQHAQRAERRQARAEAHNERAWAQRKQQLLGASGQALQEGVNKLRAGQYREAVISLTRAAELDQGDPACRVHLAQARVALGHDADAAKVLRRALDLQPGLVPMTLGLEQYYPHAEDFAVQVDALAERVSVSPAASANDYFLLGFMEFQRGWLDEAYAAFWRAARQRPKDTLLQTYLDITRPPGAKADSSPRSDSPGKRGNAPK
jgi:tetratricopeptide (TPR) repeat protein